MNCVAKSVGNEEESYMILDYYKNFDSDFNPVLMMLDESSNMPGELELEDEKRNGYLREKYEKKLK
ncbi:MAG: hypothetical protein BAJALOKI2v1_180039 [Promethearchaeota archaeon]|nr:MAG: hypothetical protein BAJALOKI2v1_180039 [Candidatus Lokiarchaeota archaeon]